MGGNPGGGEIGRFHRPLGVRGPCSIRSLSLWMLTLFLVNVAVHPASHNWPMEISDPAPWSSAGKMWAAVASGGSVGYGRLAVWVDVMVAPSGRCTVMGVVVGLMLMHGV